NAASELARLDIKVLAKRLEQLRAVLNGGDTGLVVAAIEAIETFGFKTRAEGEVWANAQTVRCEYLLEEASRLKGTSQWADALAKLDLVHRLQKEFGLELPSAKVSQMEAIESW